jgi:23S rRNA (uracil1939-C5)-methyltransferase
MKRAMMSNRPFFLEKNARFVADCIDMHHSGLGVVKVDSMVVLVKDLLPQEKALIHIMRVEKKLAYGKVIERLVSSPYRIESICPVSMACGGCPLITLSDEGQAIMKQNIVKDQVRFHGLEVDVEPTLNSPQRFHTRNKVAVPIKHNPFQMGFYRLNSHEIVEFETCYVQTHTQNNILDVIRKYPLKDELVDVKHVVLKENHDQTQMIVGFVVSKLELISKSSLIEELSKKENVVGIVAHLNVSDGNAIFKGKDIVLYGVNEIVDELEDLKFKLSLQSFYQINPHQTLCLYQKALDLAKLSKNDVLVDLYCGVGTISLLAASRVKHVIGVEINPIAITNAKENQELNHIENASFFVGDASDVTNILKDLDMKADVLIVDPPRSGLSSSVIEQIKDLGFSRVVYVSCNPMTLCANLKELSSHYDFDTIYPVDMFPNTRHCESVTSLSRKD